VTELVACFWERVDERCGRVALDGDLTTVDEVDADVEALGIARGEQAMMDRGECAPEGEMYALLSAAVAASSLCRRVPLERLFASCAC
jgi:hypothetical protein